VFFVLKASARVFVGFLVLLLMAAAGFGIHELATRYTGVLVAAVNLSPGMRLTDAMVVLRSWPVEAVPSGALGFNSLDDIRRGMYLRERVAVGQVIFPSSLTDVSPQIRTEAKRDYVLMPLTAPPDDAAKLFIGDRVDITVIPAKDGADGGLVTLPPVTIGRGWVVQHIDYADRQARESGTVRVVIEVSGRAYIEAGLSPFLLPVRMEKSVDR